MDEELTPQAAPDDSNPAQPAPRPKRRRKTRSEKRQARQERTAMGAEGCELSVTPKIPPLRVPLSDEEMDRLAQDAIDVGCGVPGQPRFARYIRQVLFSSPLGDLSYPSTPPETPPVSRTHAVSVSVTPAGKIALEAHAEAAGTDVIRYVRWRLLGIVS